MMRDWWGMVVLVVAVFVIAAAPAWLLAALILRWTTP